jgi:hypothetical protein
VTASDRALFKGLEARKLTTRQARDMADALDDLDRSMPAPRTTAEFQDALRGIPVVGGAAGVMKSTSPEHIDFDRHRAPIEPPPATRSPLVVHPSTARGPLESWTVEMAERIERSRLPEHSTRPERAAESTGPKITEDDLG